MLQEKQWRPEGLAESPVRVAKAIRVDELCGRDRIASWIRHDIGDYEWGCQTESGNERTRMGFNLLAADVSVFITDC